MKKSKQFQLPSIQILTILVLLTNICLSCGNLKDCHSNQAIYQHLDSIISNIDYYNEITESKLATLKGKTETIHNDGARYIYNKLIAENYLYYRPDSALKYIDENIVLAEMLGNKDYIAESQLLRAKIFLSNGLLEEASNCLAHAAGHCNDVELRTEYYMHMLNYWNQKSIELDVPLLPEVHTYADSLIQISASGSEPNYTLWGEFYRQHTDAERDRLRSKFKARIDEIGEDNKWYSPLCFAVALLSMGNPEAKDDEVVYMARCIESDIRHSKRELPGLGMLASIALEEGEVVYANKFMQAYLNSFSDVRDRIKIPYVLQPMAAIQSAMIEEISKENERRGKAITAMTVILILFLVVLLLCLYFWNKSRKLGKELHLNNGQLEDKVREVSEMSEKLRNANTEIKVSNDELVKLNDSLKESNFLKEKYIVDLLVLCSQYFTKMADFSKNIHRKMKVRQYDSVLKMTSSESADFQKNSKEFYNHFDTIFLSIFPDFVDKFNTMLQPGKQITVAEGQLLNTDLRIYALIRLGITNSVKIAAILGLSPQSVYNARMKMRGRALPSDKTLVERVSELCMSNTNTLLYQ